jgi:hypothetical protein
MMSLTRLLDEGEGSSMTSELGFTENKTKIIDSIELNNSVTGTQLAADYEQSQVSRWASTLTKAYTIKSRLLPAPHTVSHS